MVPPVYIGEGSPITRIGAQKTYVFFKDGVEAFLIRPGFSGKVDEFGMLIPFPTPPAIRKVPDHIFEHIAAAIDPPEVVVDLRPPPPMALRAMKSRDGKSSTGDDGLQFEAVRVLRQEAVGMYEVAVLEAGSAQALKRWMDDHGYKYPNGMDKVCGEYVEAGWCFVAVKTKVGQKAGIQPQPGQRAVNPNLPEGSTFDGSVQGMGFRFKVGSLAVPMRLSAFNAGELHNVVYLLTDGPRKIRFIPEERVVRQVTGDQLYLNVTQPLPLRIIGGAYRDIPKNVLSGLPQRRDPVPHNGAAKELFASDLLAVRSGELALAHEETEKELLRIGERLGLRGPEIDQLNAQALADSRQKTVLAALQDLKRLTMTVVDGDFPREELAKQNLTFADYKMPAKRNKPEQYDAKQLGPAPKKEGILRTGAAGEHKNSSGTTGLPVAALAVGLGGAFTMLRFRSGLGRATGLVLMLGSLVLALGQFAAGAEQGAAAKQPPTIRQLLEQLGHSDKAQAAVDALVARGKEAVPLLGGEAIEGNDLTRRGWAIVALGEIGGKDVDEILTKVQSDPKQSMLVRTWAAAARVSMTDTADGLIEKASLVQTFPALGRPIGLRLLDLLASDGEQVSAESMLSVSLRVPQLQQSLAHAILAQGAVKLSNVMATARDQNVRYQAAAYLGTLSQQGDRAVSEAVITVYRFDPQAKDVPWKGGPLYVPGLQWGRDDSRALVGHLIAWHLWCDRHGRADEQRQISNNLISISLAGAAGYQSPGFNQIGTTQWLITWGKAVGRDEVRRILKEQGVDTDSKYADVLQQL